MKIAYFIGALNRGGAETLILDICRKHKDVPCDFVCIYRHEGNILNEFKQSGVPLIQISKKRGILRYLLDVRRILKREQVTIVHSQTGANTFILALALLGTGIKIVTTFHGHLFADAPWWQRMLVYHVSKKIICVSEYQKRYYEEKWNLPRENKLEVIYNGIDFTKLDIVQNERVRELESERINLAMVGNFIKGRSQYIIVQAIQTLKEKGIINFNFYFIGRRVESEPERYDNCVRYCEENGLNNVHFLGSRSDVPAILRSIDGFVYSTEHDTFGIAVIEAIASELPIVVNDWPVMIEVCGAGNAGIRYFRTDDIEDASDKIASLLSNIDESKKVAKENAQLVRRKYSIEQHIDNLNKVYQSL